MFSFILCKIIVKPATNFGPEDRFLNWIAETADRLPFLPILNGGRTLVQPVYSSDVGKALMEIVNVRSHILKFSYTCFIYSLK
jgi:uncharacterized protein YbjT (DUF2867 family)